MTLALQFKLPEGTSLPADAKDVEILLVEDSSADAEMTLRTLKKLSDDIDASTKTLQTQGATLSDAEFADLSAHYDDDQILEIIMLCGVYRTVSYLANGLALPLEENAARFPV